MVLGRHAFFDTTLNNRRAFLACDWGRRTVAFTGHGCALQADIAGGWRARGPVPPHAPHSHTPPPPHTYHHTHPHHNCSAATLVARRVLASPSVRPPRGQGVAANFPTPRRSHPALVPAVRDMMLDLQNEFLSRRDELAALLGVDLDWWVVCCAVRGTISAQRCFGAEPCSSSRSALLPCELPRGLGSSLKECPAGPP